MPGFAALVARDRQSGVERWRAPGAVGSPTAAGDLLLEAAGNGLLESTSCAGNDASGHIGVSALALP